MLIDTAQVKAARALLGWSQTDLAEAAGLTQDHVANYETKRSKSLEVLEAIYKGLTANGIEFTARGVQMATPIYHFTGENCYADLLADVAESGAEEVLIENVANKKSPPAVVDALRKIRAKGIKVRATAEEGDTYLILPVSSYRWIPAKFYKNWVSVVYGDRVATKTKTGEPGYIVIRDKDMAEAARNKFNLVWEMLQPLDVVSTAHDHIE